MKLYFLVKNNNLYLFIISQNIVYSALAETQIFSFQLSILLYYPIYINDIYVCVCSDLLSSNYVERHFDEDGQTFQSLVRKIISPFLFLSLYIDLVRD